MPQRPSTSWCRAFAFSSSGRGGDFWLRPSFGFCAVSFSFWPFCGLPDESFGLGWFWFSGLLRSRDLAWFCWDFDGEFCG
jgi:hypothetical protein